MGQDTRGKISESSPRTHHRPEQPSRHAEGLNGLAKVQIRVTSKRGRCAIGFITSRTQAEVVFQSRDCVGQEGPKRFIREGLYEPSDSTELAEALAVYCLE
jgi:hypothetical protein